MKFIALTISLALLFSCASGKVILGSENTSNDTRHGDAPYILLISIDGYRHDYNKIHKPDFLNWFEKEGASSESLISSFPTKTFPNHLSIVTGLYPSHHGIVANHFYAPDLKQFYSLKDRNSVTNPDFYNGIPIWSLAESQGMRTATYFWPGSEAKIANHYPTYYLQYNHGTSHKERVSQVRKWLLMEKEQRPHLITLYFHDVDSAGHKYGPLAKETKAAVLKVDETIKGLYQFTKNLDYPLQIIIVSDHGMRSVDTSKLVDIIKPISEQKDQFIIEGSGPVVHFYTKNKEVINKKQLQNTISKLNSNAQGHKCYDNNSTPSELNFKDNIRAGDIICIAKSDYYLMTSQRTPPKGAHGWSQYENKDMHGILMGLGNRFKSRTQIGSVKNVDIFPMLSEILGLHYDHKIDGSLEDIKEMMR